jgi:hypothetical protein
MALRRIGSLLAVAAITAVLLTPICDVLHRCGCRALWAGGESHCNVRLSQGPHCPWCEHRALGGAAAGLVLGGQAGVYALAARRRGALVGAVAAILALPVASVAGGALAWLPTDYPHFLVRDARARLGLPEGPIPCVARTTSAASAPCCPRP